MFFKIGTDTSLCTMKNFIMMTYFGACGEGHLIEQEYVTSINNMVQGIEIWSL